MTMIASPKWSQISGNPYGHLDAYGKGWGNINKSLDELKTVNNRTIDDNIYNTRMAQHAWIENAIAGRNRNWQVEDRDIANTREDKRNRDITNAIKTGAISSHSNYLPMPVPQSKVSQLPENMPEDTRNFIKQKI